MPRRGATTSPLSAALDRWQFALQALQETPETALEAKKNARASWLQSVQHLGGTIG